MIHRHKMMLANWQTAGILPSPYLVAGYHLDGNALDMSGNGRDGEATNVTYSAGKYGLCGVFPGNGYINVATSGIDAQDAITICGWIYGGGTTGKNQGFISKGVTQGYEDFVLFGETTGYKLGFYLVTDLGNTGNMFYTDINALNSGWRHVGITWSSASAQVKMYIDGALDKTTNMTGNTVNTTTTKLAIGSYRRTPNALFAKASMDEIYIFNVALSQSDIARVMNNQNPTYIP